MNEEIDKAALIRGFISLIIFAAIIIPATIWLYERSAIGNPLCEQMKSQGYYETEWDTAGHESCKLGYSTWTGTSTNETCLRERYKTDEDNLANFGMHCVWGGPGYWAFVGSYGIIFILLALIIMWFTALWSYYRRNQKVYK